MQIYYYAPPLLLVGGFIGFYLKSYLKVKAENRATHEDLKKLIEQTAALTQTTRDIEAKISGELWDKQKRWELKRDVLCQAVRELTQLEAALQNLDAVFSLPAHRSPGERSKSASEWEEISVRFDTTAELARVVCDDASLALLQAGQQIKETALKRIRGDSGALDKNLQRRMFVQRKVIDAIRKELRLD